MKSTIYITTPASELVQQWVDLLPQGSIKAFTAAAAWGADQELEACCEWLSVPCPSYGRELRNARRPSPTPEWKPCVKLPITVHVREQRPGETHVSTREGITPVQPDDLIMRGVQGEEYPIGRELFEQTYRMLEGGND
jgi:hypothetical protein